jgi:hypothetical protein
MPPNIAPGLAFAFGIQYTPTDFNNFLANAVISNIARGDMKADQRIIFAGSTFPLSPTVGEMAFRTDLVRMFIWTGVVWADVATTANTPATFRGLNLVWTSNAKVNIGVGSCRDSGGIAFMVNLAAFDVDLSVAGVGGLDTGSEAANTWYFVWLIQKSTDLTTNGILSLSSSAPTMPAGYDLKRLVGAVRNNGSSNIVLFYQLSSGTSREIRYDGLQAAALSGGGATTYTDVDLSALIPSAFAGARYAVCEIYGRHSVSPSSGGTTEADLRINGSADATGMVHLQWRKQSGTQGSAYETVLIPTDSAGLIEYMVDSASAANGTPTLDIVVIGFRMNLD